jgi:hypothetical protein
VGQKPDQSRGQKRRIWVADSRHAFRDDDDDGDDLNSMQPTAQSRFSALAYSINIKHRILSYTVIKKKKVLTENKPT